MNIDVSYTPFSRFGSYIAFSQIDDSRAKLANITPGLWMRCVHGDAAKEVFRLEVLVDGVPAPYEISAEPAVLTLSTERGSVRVCISSTDQVRFQGNGIGLRLVGRDGANNCAIPQPEGRWLITMATAFRNYVAVPLAGELKVDAPWGIAKCNYVHVDLLPDSTEFFDIALDQVVGAWTPGVYSSSFDDIADAIDHEFRQFAQGCGSVPTEFAETAEAAAYLNWSTVVHPCGLLGRPAMLMSKNWMTNVWSWDHAFNAMALAYGHPELAWDQMMTMFDHQQPEGQIPDFVNDVVMLYCFVKPPIHGWILSKMMDANPWFRDKSRVEEIYEPMCKFTDWWFAHRNPDGDGLPQYHHGNDSGWDNGTVFDIGLPVKGCDLAAFLVVQMSVLADMATMLGREEESKKWSARSEETLQKLLAKLWKGDCFVCPSAIDGSVTEESDSIFTCLPIILGDKLPLEIRQKLASDIERHLTEWGPATENVGSPLYERDGYWRGPIWAPPTMIIADGLRRAGFDDLAKDVAGRFCKLCKKSEFAENFDAVTGEPLRDRAYTWTSSVFLVLAHEFLS